MSTSEVFEQVIRRRDKGKRKAVGHIWLDGETVSISVEANFNIPLAHPSNHCLTCCTDLCHHVRVGGTANRALSLFEQ